MVDFKRELLKLRAKKHGLELEEYIARLEAVREAAEAWWTYKFGEWTEDKKKEMWGMPEPDRTFRAALDATGEKE